MESRYLVEGFQILTEDYTSNGRTTCLTSREMVKVCQYETGSTDSTTATCEAREAWEEAGINTDKLVVRCHDVSWV